MRRPKNYIPTYAEDYAEAFRFIPVMLTGPYKGRKHPILLSGLIRQAEVNAISVEDHEFEKDFVFEDGSSFSIEHYSQDGVSAHVGYCQGPQEEAL